MTNEHSSNEQALRLAPPLSEWPDGAEWWAVDGRPDSIGRGPAYFWTDAPTLGVYGRWALKGQNPCAAAGRVALPADLDWRDTLVSRADKEQWEGMQKQDALLESIARYREQDAKPLWEMTDAEMNEMARESARRLVQNMLAEKQAEPDAPAHKWTDEAIRERAEKLYLEAQRAVDDVSIHNLKVRIAELEQERDAHKRRCETIEHARDYWAGAYWDTVNKFGGPVNIKQAAELWRLHELVRESDEHVGFTNFCDNRMRSVYLLTDSGYGETHHATIADAIAHLEAETQQPKAVTVEELRTLFDDMTSEPELLYPDGIPERIYEIMDRLDKHGIARSA